MCGARVLSDDHKGAHAQGDCLYIEQLHGSTDAPHVQEPQMSSNSTRGNFLALPQELRDLVYAECNFLDLKQLARTHPLIKHEVERHYKAFRSVEEKDWLPRKACGNVHLHPISTLR